MSGAVAKGDMSFPTSASEYEICSPVIGEGGYAKVYRGKVKSTGKEVAVKVVDLEEFGASMDMDEVHKEILIMRQLLHENVVRVYTAFVEEHFLWIVMPLLLGGSCATILKRNFSNGLKDEAILAAILKGCLKGLEYFHKDGLIHRDIKGGNILIGDAGEVQLADFGVSASLIEGGDRKAQRRTCIGTACWMAPEVMDETNGYGTSADIWSLGITAMELAFGDAPYAKYDPIKVLLLTLQEPAPTFKLYGEKHGFSDSFRKMVASCLAKDPKKRPTAKELLKKDFFKKAASDEYIKEHLLKNLPETPDYKTINPLLEDESSAKKSGSWGSWIFDAKDLAAIRRGENIDLQPLQRPPISESEAAPPPPSGQFGRFTVEVLQATAEFDALVLPLEEDELAQAGRFTELVDSPELKATSRFVVEDPPEEKTSTIGRFQVEDG